MTLIIDHMPCDICARLRDEVARREGEYLSLRERLTASESTLSDVAARQELAAAFSDASIDLQIARLELEKHRNHHAKAN